MSFKKGRGGVQNYFLNNFEMVDTNNIQGDFLILKVIKRKG